LEYLILYGTAIKSTEATKHKLNASILNPTLAGKIIGLLIFEDIKFRGLSNFSFKQKNSCKKFSRVQRFASVGVATPEFFAIVLLQVSLLSMTKGPFCGTYKICILHH